MTRILFTDVLATSPPVIDLNFAAGSYSGGTLASLLSVSNSTGGYVTNADGTLCLIAPNTPRVGGIGNHTNLFAHSQDLSNVTNLGRVTAIDNNIVAPDGTITATKITDDSATNTHYFANQINSITAGAVFTQSIYAKLGGGTTGGRYLDLILQSNVLDGYAQARFDLLSGTITFQGHGGSVSSILGASITSAANGFFRLSVTGTTDPADNALFCQYRLLDASQNPTYTGDGTSFVYFWGAQVEQASAATAYIPTTTAAVTAVLSGPNGTGLLVEESRTNIFLQSGDISNAQWSAFGIYTATSNAATTPDGTLNATFVIPNNVVATHKVRQDVSILNNTFYSTSFFVKAAGYSKFGMRCSQRTGEYATFDLQTGTVISVTTGASIQQLSNGWFRCTMIQQEIFGAGNEQFEAYIMDSGYSSGSPEAYLYAADQSSGMYIWGGQNEVGQFPTSYFPTTTVAATRDADAPRAAGQHESVWLLKQLTIFQDWGGSAGGPLPRLFDGAASTGPWCGIDSATDIRLFGDGINVAVGTFSAGRGPSSPFKVAMFGDTLATAGEGYGISLNGAAVVTRGFAWGVPDAAHISIGNIPAGTRAFNGYLRRMQLWDNRLSDAAVQRLSQ